MCPRSVDTTGARNAIVDEGPSRRDADAGFSVVELLVALSVLVFTLIALMGLATTSSFMVSSSRQRATLVNASAGYLERVRQEPFANVGTPGGDPAGDLAAQVTTSAPYVITVTPAVTWGRPEDPTNHALKTVTLTVSSTSLSGGSAMGFTASALVADVGAIGAPASSQTTPSASITSPADGSVVWGSAVPVTVSGATNSTSRTLIWMDVIDGVQSWGSVAVDGVTAQHSWSWNTTTAREGNHKIAPRVTDSSGAIANGGPITLTIDNLAPTVPGSMSSAFASGTGGTVWWNGSTDGTDVDGSTALPASHYVLTGYRQPADAALAADYTRWSGLTGLTSLTVMTAPTSAAPLGVSGLTQFSRYCFAVSSSSPDRGAASGLLSAAATTVGSTKCTAAGTWAVSFSNKKYTVNVTVNLPSGPTFPWTGTATTKIYRLTSATQAISSGTLLKTVSSTYPNWATTAGTDAQTTASNGQPTPYYYAAITTLTPTGFGSASASVNSCVLGPPADMTTTGTRQLVIAQW
jgi:Tfp pilus assembly protein PilV